MSVTCFEHLFQEPLFSPLALMTLHCTETGLRGQPKECRSFLASAPQDFTLGEGRPEQ
jgi:hypothetical protein